MTIPTETAQGVGRTGDPRRQAGTAPAPDPARQAPSPLASREEKPGILSEVGPSPAGSGAIAGGVRGRHEFAGAHLELLARIQEILCMIDRHGLITYMSPQIERYGFRAEEAVGRPFLDYVIPEDRERVGADFERTIASGAEFPTEFRARDSQGRLFWFEELGRVIRDERGNPVGIQTVVRDITERKQAEENVREREGWWRSLVENLAVSFARIGLDGRFLYVNRQFLKWGEMTFDEVVGRGPELLQPWLSADDYRRMVQAVQHTVATREKSECDLEYRLPNGQRLCVVQLAYPWLDRDGHLAGVEVLGYDVTGRRQAEEVLRFRAVLLDNALDAIHALDEKGTILYVNKSMIRATGYSREELIGQNIGMLNPPEDATLVLPRVRMIVEQGKAWFNLTHIRKDGSTYPVEVFARRVNVGGRTIVVAADRDITARRKAEEELRRSQDLYRHIVENLNDVIYRVSPSGLIEYVSPSVQGVLGYAPAELTGHVFLELVHPDDRERIQGAFADVLSGRLYPSEYRLLKKGGGVCWVRTSSRIASEDGRPVGVQGVLADVTKEKAAEEALRASEARYRALVEEQSEMVCRWLPDTTLTFVNVAYCRLFGKTREELIGTKWIALYPDRQRAELETAVRSFLAAGRTVRRVVAVPAGDRWIEWVDSPVVDPAGNVAEVQAVGRDITEKRALEAQLAHVSEIEREKIRRDLHDGICQQLSGLALLAESLKRSLEIRAPEESSLAAEIVDVASDTVNNAREMARSLVPEIGSYAELVAKLEEVSHRIRKVYRVACRVRGGANVGLSDPNTLSQIFLIAQEAAVNAARHARAKTILIAVHGGGNRPAKLTVKDDGVGLKPGKPGGGMGLEIMRARASLIGWAFAIRRGEGGGTVVECLAGPGSTDSEAGGGETKP